MLDFATNTDTLVNRSLCLLCVLTPDPKAPSATSCRNLYAMYITCLLPNGLTCYSREHHKRPLSCTRDLTPGLLAIAQQGRPLWPQRCRSCGRLGRPQWWLPGSPCCAAPGSVCRSPGTAAPIQHWLAFQTGALRCGLYNQQQNNEA